MLDYCCFIVVFFSVFGVFYVYLFFCFVMGVVGIRYHPIYVFFPDVCIVKLTLLIHLVLAACLFRFVP